MLAETSEDGTALAESSEGGLASAGSAEWFDIPTSTLRRRKEDGEVLVSDPVPRSRQAYRWTRALSKHLSGPRWSAGGAEV